MSRNKNKEASWDTAGSRRHAWRNVLYSSSSFVFFVFAFDTHWLRTVHSTLNSSESYLLQQLMCCTVYTYTVLAIPSAAYVLHDP